jgi:apolipoprotein N-acyltransferase
VNRPTHRVFAGLALSGGALVLGYPPFSIPVLPFLGLVPLLLFLARPYSNRDVFLGAAAFSIPYFLGTMGWLFLLVKFTPAGAIGAAIAFLLHLGTFAFFPVGLVVVRRAGGVSPVLAAPFLWVVAEHARTFGDLDFEWVTLGFSLSDWPLLIQHADLIGVWGLSLWLVWINALAAATLARGTSRPIRWAAAAGIALSLAAPVFYGVVRDHSLRERQASSPRLRVAALQPNIPQHLKWSPDARAANLATLNRIIRDAERGSPDLVVAPEASLPLIMQAGVSTLPAGVEPGSRPLLLGIVRGVGELVPVEEGGQRGYRYATHRNSAVLAGPDRAILDIHDKATLVPMTEAIPYRDVFGFVLPFMRQQFGRFEAGPPIHPLEIETGTRRVKLGTLICFEVLHAPEVRDVVDRGADVLVNITNDAWFGRSNMPWYHVGVAVVRAIETRRSVVRSANTGITALIDPVGRVTSRTNLFEEDILVGEIPVVSIRTPYMEIGNLVVGFAYVGAALFLGRAYLRFRAGLANFP